MNDQEALKKFADKALPLCLAETFDLRLFKEERKRFYDEASKKGKKLGHPGFRDVAEAVIDLLRTRGNPIAKILELLTTRPFFKQIGDSEHEKLVSRIAASADRYSSATLEEIQKGRAFEAVQRHKEEQITEQVKQQLTGLEAQLAEKQAEYEALPSVLDRPLEDPEPDFDPATDDRKSWWERFYLKDNPFRSQSGLTQIDRDLYDQVVVRTAPFDDILSRLQKDESCLFQTAFLLAGGYGYGKTTFIDYLSYVLLTKHNILSIRITSARPSPTAMAYMDTFAARLRTELGKELRNSALRVDDSLAGDDQGFLNEACAALTATRYKGILVILDDYHKHGASPALFGFLGLLQVTKDELAREGLRVGFVVAGMPEWKDELRREPKLGGFLDGPPVVMPDLTPESIARVINQRIQAYSFDAKPRTLKLDFIRQIFNTIGATSGYRDYITRIVAELEQNNLAIVDAPVEISQAELDRIKAEIEHDPAVKDALNKLLTLSSFKRFTREQTTKCVELLVQTYVSEGVFEQTRLFDLNKHYFMRLKEEHLIQKRKENHPTYGSTHSWVVRSQLQQAFERVKTRTGYSPQDYFLKIYGGEVFARRQSQSVTGTASQALNPLTETVDFKLAANVRTNVDLATTFFEGARSQPESSQQGPTLERLQQAITTLCNAYFALDESAHLFDRARLVSAESRLQHHWIGSDESITELFRRFTAFKAEPSRLNFAAAHKLGVEVFQSLANHFVELCKDVCIEGRAMPYRQHARRHTDSELEIFRIAQTDHYSGDREDHFKYVERVTCEVERRLRAFLYTTTQCLFGERNYFAHTPAAAQQYAHRNMNQPTYSTIQNLYEQLTRGHYREILQNNGLLKKHIVDRVVEWTNDEWTLFGDMFIEQTINTSHQKVSAFTMADRHRYDRYCKLCQEFLEGINRCVTEMIENTAFLMGSKPLSGFPDVEECFVRFCFLQGRVAAGADSANRWRTEDDTFFRQREHLYDHVVPRESYQSIKAIVTAALEHSGFYVIDMLELDQLRTSLTSPIPEIWAALAFAAHGERVFEVIPWFGSSVLIREAR
jgi:hypothetical protein